MLDPAFHPHNLHHDSTELFAKADPQLKRLAQMPLVHQSPLLAELPGSTPGIYSLSGGRQVGKTTLIKQWFLRLLAQGRPPSRLVFLSGELIPDGQTLLRLVLAIAEPSDPGGTAPLVLALDEVTYIRDWPRAVKYLADAGTIENAVLLITGSDLGYIKEARMTFPGRRGQADTVDFVLHPLSFRETVAVKRAVAGERLAALADGAPVTAQELDILYAGFDDYLVHGGFLTAMNDLAQDGRIRPATLATYSDWVRGDALRRGKSENTLREILGAVLQQHGTQVTWHSLAAVTSIDHHATVADYIELLSTLGVLFVLPALAEDKLRAAPKKARKVLIADPFILHCLAAWLRPEADPFQSQIRPRVAEPEWASKLAEAVVASHFARLYASFYIKAAGEVDLAYTRDGRFWPVEVKWTTQIRPQDLKQVSKYPNALLLTKARQPGMVGGVPSLPLPLALLRLGGAAAASDRRPAGGTM